MLQTQVLVDGGGGAGGTGSDGTGPGDVNTGGAGIQLPATYRSHGTVGQPGPGGGGYWLAGGGGSGVYPASPVTQEKVVDLLDLMPAPVSGSAADNTRGGNAQEFWIRWWRCRRW